MNTVARCHWTGHSRWPELKEHEIHVWKADLDRVRPLCAELERGLPLSERREARHFARDADRDRYILTCSLRRTILSRYLRAEPGELKFFYGKHGKPELSSGALRFNLSHSFGLMVCAVSKSCDVGIDVERIRSGVEERIAGWFFSLRALRYLENLPEPLRAQRFFQGWTRMEAYSKAFGAGLAENLENLEVLLEVATTWFSSTRSARARNLDCRLQDFQPRRGYAAAVAARGGECKLKYCTWQARYAIR